MRTECDGLNPSILNSKVRLDTEETDEERKESKLQIGAHLGAFLYSFRGANWNNLIGWLGPLSRLLQFSQFPWVLGQSEATFGTVTA